MLAVLTCLCSIFVAGALAAPEHSRAGFGKARSSGCAAATPHGPGINLSPPNAELPVGSTASFEATVSAAGVVPQSGRGVKFKVICGPNTGRSATRNTAVHSNTGSGVPSAYFMDADKGGPGTDLISATTTTSGHKTESATISVLWSPPVDCGQPLKKLGYLLALQCKLAAAKPLVRTVLEVGQCAVGVATFLAPAAKLAKLVQAADKAASAEKLAKDVGASTPSRSSPSISRVSRRKGS